jgi:hypothetical protein
LDQLASTVDRIADALWHNASGDQANSAIGQAEVSGEELATDHHQSLNELATEHGVAQRESGYR